jgi:hypothetical protein
MKYQIRPAQAADIAAFSEFPLPRTIKALVVIYKGELAAIAGVTLENGLAEVFSHVKDGVDAPSITVWRCALQLIQWVKEQNLPAIAVASHDKPRSGAFLERLGFTYMGNWNNERTYRL